MKISLTLQYHPPTGECAYFPATDSLPMRLALVEDATLLRLLGKVAKRIDELAKSRLVVPFEVPRDHSEKIFQEAGT